MRIGQSAAKLRKEEGSTTIPWREVDIKKIFYIEVRDT